MRAFYILFIYFFYVRGACYDPSVVCLFDPSATLVNHWYSSRRMSDFIIHLKDIVFFSIFSCLIRSYSIRFENVLILMAFLDNSTHIKINTQQWDEVLVTYCVDMKMFLERCPNRHRVRLLSSIALVQLEIIGMDHNQTHIYCN